MRRHVPKLALGATVGWLLACGGGLGQKGETNPPVEPEVTVQPAAPVEAAPAAVHDEAQADEPVTRPKTAQPGTLLVLRGAGAACELVLLGLPGLEERALGPGPCHARELFVEQTGKREIVLHSLVDLEAGTAVELPPLPSRPEALTDEVFFDASGRVVAATEWGEGEPVWMEGPSYPIHRRAVHVLVDGGWIERATTTWGGDAPSTEAENAAFREIAAPAGVRVAFNYEGPAGEWISDAALRATLDALGGEGEGWYTIGPDPLLAFQTVQMGEGSALEPPVLVQRGDAWVILPGIPETLETLDRRGDWVVAGGSGWVLVDLQVEGGVAGGAGSAWFWPEGVPAP